MLRTSPHLFYKKCVEHERCCAAVAHGDKRFILSEINKSHNDLNLNRVKRCLAREARFALCKYLLNVAILSFQLENVCQRELEQSRVIVKLQEPLSAKNSLF